MTIISFSRRFIFIKTKKTAGTTVEVHLARVCGADDIVTPVNPAVEGHQPRNHGDTYYNHMPATCIFSLQPDAFKSFFKFCFERHPVEKCLSHYAMLKNSPAHTRLGNPVSWQAYLDRGEFPVDHRKYCDDSGAVLVDKIYRYENFADSVRDIEKRLDIVLAPITAREKSGFRNVISGVPSFADVMSDVAQRKRIMSAFAESLSITPYD